MRGLEEARVQIESDLGEGSLGSTFSARLEDGTVVAAKRLKRGAVLPPLQQLARLSPSGAKALVPLHNVRSRDGDRWVLSELAAGVPLSTVLARGRLAPMCAVAVAMGVLDAVAALHQVGLWHGALHAGNVHLGPDGSVRLGDYCLVPAGGHNESKLRAADSQAAGTLLCTMLRLPADGETGRRTVRASKLAASPLGELARGMARGPRGKRLTAYAAIDARLALWEAAGRLASRRMQAAAKERLAELVAGPPRAAQPAGELPAPKPAPTGPPRHGPRRLSRLMAGLLAAAIAASVIAILPVAPLRSAFGSRPAEGAVSSAFAELPARDAAIRDRDLISRAQTPGALPSLGPASAGEVSGVQARLVDPTCAPGALCLIHVEVWVRPSQRPRQVAWTVKSIPLCAGPIVDLGAGSFTAQPGWTHVASENSFAIPKSNSRALVIVSTLPDVAASDPLPMSDARAGC